MKKNIDAESLKIGLRNIKEYAPRNEKFIEIGNYLADALDLWKYKQIDNESLIVKMHNTLSDLRSGLISPVLKQIKRDELVGLSEETYDSFRLEFPNIIKAIAPEDFAESVEEFHKRYYTKEFLEKYKK